MNKAGKLKSEKLIAVVILIITAILYILQPWYTADHALTDVLYQRPGNINNQIKIIKIDEKTLEKYGPTSEWSREIPGKLVEILSADADAKPLEIVFDIMYIGTKDEKTDAYFAEQCEKAGNVVLAANIVYDNKINHDDEGNSYLNDRNISQIEMPYQALAEAGTIGFANTLQDKDGYIRQTQLYVENGDTTIDSLSYVAYKKYCEATNTPLKDIELNGQHQTEFGFTGKGGDYENVSLCDVLDGNIDPRTFTNCIVMVGAYAPGLLDSFNVAVQRGSQMYGVEIHANIVQAFIDGKCIQPVNKYLAAGVMVLLVLLYFFLVHKSGVFLAAAECIGFTGVFIIAGLFLNHKGFSLPLLYGIIIFVVILIYKIVLQYVVERVQKKKVLNAMKKYVAPSIVERQLKTGDFEIVLGGESREVAVLFVDIRGFTSMSEKLEPQEVVGILNEYLELVTKSIFEQQGTLDKFVGDAAMAVFNAPFDLDDYVYRAVCAAKGMTAGAEKLSEKLQQKYGRTISFGVGVHCGPAVVGNIGCDFRMDYTAIGDTVNTAARLESKAGGGQILISDAVYEILKDRISVTTLGKIDLKGKAEGVLTYQVDEVKQ